MCFNPLITWATAGLSISTAVIVKIKHKPASFYFPPAYFGFMEVLQGLMYTQLDSRPSPHFINILVYIAYAHVCFQPLVINYWLGSFIGEKKQEMYRFTLKLCFIGSLFLLARVFISGETPLCSSFESLCSSTPKVYYGLHHITWSLPLTAAGWAYVTPSIALHMFLFFMPGVLLGFWRLMFLFFILGPFLSSYITSNPSEQSSIWCVMGLWLLMITVFTALRKPPKFFFPDETQ